MDVVVELMVVWCQKMDFYMVEDPDMAVKAEVTTKAEPHGS